MRIEEWAEFLDVREAEPGVWRYLRLSARSREWSQRWDHTTINVDGELATFGDAHDVNLLRRSQEYRDRGVD